VSTVERPGHKHSPCVHVHTHIVGTRVCRHARVCVCGQGVPRAELEALSALLNEVYEVRGPHAPDLYKLLYHRGY
jgi:hypothetical protein